MVKTRLFKGFRQSCKLQGFTSGSRTCSVWEPSCEPGGKYFQPFQAVLRPLCLPALYPLHCPEQGEVSRPGGRGASPLQQAVGVRTLTRQLSVSFKSERMPRCYLVNSLVLKVTVLTLVHILEAPKNWVTLGKHWFLRKGHGSVVVQGTGEGGAGYSSSPRESERQTRTEIAIPRHGVEVLVVLCFKYSVCASRHNKLWGTAIQTSQKIQANSGAFQATNPHPTPTPGEHHVVDMLSGAGCSPCKHNGAPGLLFHGCFLSQ